MANQKIHEYPLERFVYGDDDYYDIDYWDGTNYQTAKILGSTIKAAILSGIAISLTAPSAFIVGGSPTDGLGTLTLTAAGLANQYIRGDGTLATFPTSSGGGNSVNYYLNGGTAASVPTYYQMSKIPVIGTGVDFSLAGNGLISQWLTDLNDPNVTEIPAGNWNFEMYFSASSAGGVPKFYIEILKYDGTTFTTIANNSAAPESITSGTTIDLYLTSVAVPLTPLLVTDRLAIRVYIVDSTLGRTIIQHTQNSHLCQIITSFSSGVSSLNGLTKQTQYLAVGTAGTDFNINSVTDTHTFNLPTASATKRGALSSLDWIAFNGKLSGLTIGLTPISSGVAGRVLFEGAGNVAQEDSAFFWDNTNKRLGIGTTTPASSLDLNGSMLITGSINSQGLGYFADSIWSNVYRNLWGAEVFRITLGTNNVGIGTTSPVARLDVRAQGALSTDLAFRVRNSADTKNIMELRGDSETRWNGLPAVGNYVAIKNYTSYDATIDLMGGSGIKAQISMDPSSNPNINKGLNIWNPGIVGQSTAKINNIVKSGLEAYGAGYGFNWAFTSNVDGIFTQAERALWLTSTKSMVLYNGSSIIDNHSEKADSFEIYSSDITAGNAAPHFRTEDGSVIKLYQNAAVTTSQGIADALTNLGMLASSTIVASSLPVKLTSQTLIQASWALVGNYYEYSFSNANIDTTSDVSVTPQNSSYQTAYNANILPYVAVTTGVATFYAQFPPQADMVVDIVITQTS